jgi:putative serine protease PepD
MAAPAPAAASTTRKTIAVPMSVLITVAALIGAVIMFGIGYAVGDSGNGSSSSSAPAGFATPNNGNNNNGFPQLPNNPFTPSTGNGSGSTGNGGSQQTPSQTTGSGAFLGVGTQASSDGSGVQVNQVVSGSAAADAGLQQGDVITQFDGQKVTTPAQLGTAVASHQAGDKVQVTFTRNGQTKTVTVTLGARSASNN